MPHQLASFFQPDGRVQFIYDDPAFEIARLAEIGMTKIERASNVEPTPANTWRYDFAPLGDVWPPGFALTRGCSVLEAEKREIETLLGENRINENSKTPVGPRQPHHQMPVLWVRDGGSAKPCRANLPV